MKKGKKILIITLSAVLIVISSISFFAYFTFLHRYKGKTVVNEWSQDAPFDYACVSTIEKKVGEPFVILNFADIQMCDLEDYFDFEKIHAKLTYLVETVKPDLITLTGDQTWSNENLMSLRALIGWLDGYKIPYAPVFGNHDYGNSFDSAVASRQYCCDLYEKGKYSLFKRGYTNLGSLGNYAVVIKENGKIFRTLYMIDSGYTDMISDEQIGWLVWTAEGIAAENGGELVPSLCFMHKPVPEFAKAYQGYLNGECEAWGDVQVHYSLYGSAQNGFFEKAKECGATDIVCGHQHGNNFTIKYEGVRLTFALKTGELGGAYEDEDIRLSGASVITLGGDVSIESVFLP